MLSPSNSVKISVLNIMVALGKIQAKQIFIWGRENYCAKVKNNFEVFIAD